MNQAAIYINLIQLRFPTIATSTFNIDEYSEEECSKNFPFHIDHRRQRILSIDAKTRLVEIVSRATLLLTLV